MTDHDRTYEKPRISDYGTLDALTAAVHLLGTEDGSNKDNLNHHDLVPSEATLP